MDNTGNQKDGRHYRAPSLNCHKFLGGKGGSNGVARGPSGGNGEV